MRLTKARRQPNATRQPPWTFHLSKEEELELKEELAATGRSMAGIMTEALRIRRSALDAIGIEIETTMATELARLIEEHCRAGAKVLAKLKK